MKIRCWRNNKGWKAEYTFTVTMDRDDTFRSMSKKTKAEMEAYLYKTMQLKIESMIVDQALELIRQGCAKVDIDGITVYTFSKLKENEAIVSPHSVAKQKVKQKND